MRRVLGIAVVLVAFAAPAGTAAAKTSKADKQEAKRECRAERGTTDATREAFKAKWGGFGHCLHQTAREAKAERKAARRNAAKDCKAEHVAKHDFGKCVSEKAKAKRQEQDQEDAADSEDATNAAQECDTERSADRKAFEDKYGTNHNKKNAFGKCVSQKSHEDDGEGDGGS
jgi:hypothetical protein